MDDATFLAAVLAEPASDAPRLVYADWLDERGSPRGEFIRVQCELAGWQAEMDSIPVNGRHHRTGRTIIEQSQLGERLRRREGALLEAYAPGWLSGLPGDWLCGNTHPNTNPAHTPLATFARGFVSAVTLSLADWLGGPCGRCNEGGRINSERPFRYTEECPACAGTGRTEGVGPRLVQSCPLTGVRFSDRRPVREGDSYWWWVVSSRPNRNRPEAIPAELVHPLSLQVKTHNGMSLGNSAGFPTEAAALSALSVAAISWALARPTPEVEARRG